MEKNIMALNSFVFVICFMFLYTIIGICSFVMRGRLKFQRYFLKILILAASYGFVGIVAWEFALSLLLVTFVAYVCARLIESSQRAAFLLRAGIIICLLMLGYYKYSNFFVVNLASVFHINYSAINIVLPLGISFYIFSAISYMMDVYHQKYHANRSWLDVALYISFFPKLTSGPIVRANRFFEQLHQWNGLHYCDFNIGIQRFVVGMFKKMVLADHLGVFVDDVFFAPSAYSSLSVIWATVTYSLQIYFDFSGYSDMAIGISRILGFQFDNNFNFPYLSKNLTEFWKRWHISLSSWLQEYLYIPLGGNRKGKLRTYVNLFLTMLIGGLWHGADWSFVLWGALHGMGLIVHKLFCSWKKKIFGDAKKTNVVWDICSVVLTFLYANFCWIFFRAENINKALVVVKQMFLMTEGIQQPYTWTIFALLLLIIVYCVVLCRLVRNKQESICVSYPVLNMNSILGITLFFVLCGLVIGMAYYGNTAFIYGAF